MTAINLQNLIHTNTFPPEDKIIISPLCSLYCMPLFKTVSETITKIQNNGGIRIDKKKDIAKMIVFILKVMRYTCQENKFMDYKHKIHRPNSGYR